MKIIYIFFSRGIVSSAKLTLYLAIFETLSRTFYRLYIMDLIYDYFSYHDFLDAWFESAKTEDPLFSQREFLRRGQINGSAVLHRVFQGQRLPKKYIKAFSKAMELNISETEYWEKLVEYEDAKTIKQRAKAFSTLLELRSEIPKYQMDENAIDFFKRWYYPVVREVVHLLDGNEDCNKISRMIIPTISPAQASNALQFLEKNGFLKRNKSGILELSDPIISSGAPRVSALLAAYHQKNLEINNKALDLVDKKLLSMSSINVTVSQRTYEKMRQELAEFRKRMMGLAQEDRDPEQVFHLNFTFLPRSRPAREQGDES